MSTNNNPNRLAKEKSPYLLQHAYNPVDWFPWSDEAFEKANRDHKPILLSIGYSTCHWCHVMERESFEDEEVASLLNNHYISIKVDREERPDIDHLYMSVCQSMTGHGGWPLTIFMTPDKKPFFAGTYFPKHNRFGRTGLVELLVKIRGIWEKEPEQIKEVSAQITEQVKAHETAHLHGEWDERVLHRAFEQFQAEFDVKFGGFGSAPKFPTPHNLSFLLAYGRTYDRKEAIAMAERTLEGMARGGIRDHVGHGFARYSTDERWLVPHFEKMLYDNALLAMAYLDAYQWTGNKRYADLAESIFAYVLRDMTSLEGAFYSAEDADSEGVEGKFYVWTPQQVKEALGAERGSRYCELYDITEEGNFEGNSIPNLLQRTVEQYARERGLDPETLEAEMEASRAALFEWRERRIHPHKDDKILTAWNGLTIAALAKGAKALQSSEYADAAARAVRFIETHLRRTEDGRLLARYRDGEAALLGYIDDYAFYIWGLTELYEASGDASYLHKALALLRQMIDLFWDGERGGFYFYGRDGERLLTRMKEIYDGALPSGNSVAAMLLSKYAAITQEAELSQLAEQQLKAFAGAAMRYPGGYSMLMQAMLGAFRGSREIVIAGAGDDSEVQRMLAAVRQTYLPNSILLFVPDGEEGERLRSLLPALQDKTAINGKPTAYVCENFACQQPVHDADELKRLLSRG